MPRWEDEDYWDDAEETDHRRFRRPAREKEDSEPAEPLVPPRAVEQELEGSVYDIPDDLWGFEAVFRSWHPGVCVRLDITAEVGFCYKGTDARRVRKRFRIILVEPSQQNGLKKTTAFALEPHRIPERRLREIHNSDSWRGVLERETLQLLQADLDMHRKKGGDRP
jgi:hypothetical protein